LSSEYSQIKDVIDKRETELLRKEKEEILLIQVAKMLMDKVKHGLYSDVIISSTSNKFLEEFKQAVNKLKVAINRLEKQVQSNAEVSSQANYIVSKTSNIANKIVDNANKKEFKGKDSISCKRCS
jgi:methyl-accepting chemotaxis protein